MAMEGGFDQGFLEIVAIRCQLVRIHDQSVTSSEQLKTSSASRSWFVTNELQLVADQSATISSYEE